ncbi:MAG: hypothetical protein Q9194_004604 [Teloschistes cf. exilis]
MRLRLGLLQDTAAIDKQIARDAAEAQAKRQKSEVPTVKTEAQTKADEAIVAKEKDKAAEKAKPASKPRIRPLSEAKAIDAGANFASETFLLSVGIGLIIFERWWSSRKENTRREDVSDRIAELEESEKSARRALVELEKELLRMRAKEGKEKSPKRILPKEVWELEEKEEEERQPKASGILSYLRRPLSFRSRTAVEQVKSEPLPSQEQMPTGSETHTEKPTATTINDLQISLHQLSVTLDLLPVASSAQLLPLLNTYIGSSTLIHQTAALPSSRTLLQQVTATAPTRPLREHSTNVLSDICHSIAEVAKMSGNGQGRQVLEDFLGDEDAKNIESFWAEEWICD